MKPGKEETYQHNDKKCNQQEKEFYYNYGAKY